MLGPGGFGKAPRMSNTDPPLKMVPTGIRTRSFCHPSGTIFKVTCTLYPDGQWTREVETQHGVKEPGWGEEGTGGFSLMLGRTTKNLRAACFTPLLRWRYC